MSNCFLLITLLFSCSIFSFSQTFGSDESAKINIPEYVMKNVVQRVLIWNFKPRKQKKIIYIAEKLIDKTWLPEIKNIEFQILNIAEIDENKQIYFFTNLEKTNKHYDIGFAFGTPNCDYFGTTWSFKILKKRTKVWMPNKGFGAGCSIGSN